MQLPRFTVKNGSRSDAEGHHNVFESTKGSWLRYVRLLEYVTTGRGIERRKIEAVMDR